MEENLNVISEDSCRACLIQYSVSDTEHKLISIFGKVQSKDDNSDLDDDIVVCDAFEKINVKVGKKDILPKFICQSCLKSLKDAYNFRQLCIISKNKYIKQLKHLKNINNNETNSSNIDEPADDRFETISTESINLISEGSNDAFKNDEAKEVQCKASIVMEYDTLLHLKKEEDDELKNVASPWSMQSASAQDDCDQKTNSSEDYNPVDDYSSSDSDSTGTTSIESDEIYNQSTNTKNEKNESLNLNNSMVENRKNIKLNKILPTSVRLKLPLIGIVFYSEDTYTKHGMVTKCNNCCKFLFTSRVEVHEMSCRYVLNEIGFEHLPITDNNDKYMCFYCNEEFENICAIESHISTKHNSERPFKCEFCNDIFSYYLSHKIHVDYHKNFPNSDNSKFEQKRSRKPLVGVVTYSKETFTEHGVITKCSNCCKYFATSWIKLHESSCRRMLYELGVEYLPITDNTDKYICFYCSEHFEEIDTIENHIVTKHEKDNPFFCKFCGKLFTHFTPYSRHLKYHNDKISTIECKFCGKYFTSVKLKKHMAVHDHVAQNCEICGKTFMNTVRLKTHIRSSHSNPFKCKFCEKLFSNSHHLQNHERVHTGERPYACHICDKKFKIRNDLLVHIYKHPNAEFNCNYCTKGFTSNADLTKHLRRHETHDYQCEYCGQLMPTLKLYEEHKLTHENPDKVVVKPKIKRKYKHVKPVQKYKCSLCKDEFRLPMALEKHLKMHDQNRPFPCNMCSKAYKVKRHLQQHIKKDHLNEVYFPCKQCNKVYRDSSSRNQHMNIVHKALGDLYKCTLCSKRFQSLDNLEKHEKSHGPNVCIICGKEYCNKYVLLCHIHEKHPEQENLDLTAKKVKSDIGLEVKINN